MTKETNPHGLTNKQRLFAELFAETGNGAHSARTAGYSDAHAASTAYKLRKEPAVEAYILELAEEAGDGLAEISAGYLHRNAKKIIDDPKTANKDKLKAIEIIAKLKGFNAPKEINAKIEVTKLDELTDEELLEIINGGTND